MHALLLMKGALSGAAVAAPLGPVALLCMQRTLSQGARAGFTAGLGAACADALCGSVLAFGLVEILGFLSAQDAWLGAGAGMLLVGLGVRSWRKTARPAHAAPRPRGALSFSACFLLTFTNPGTLAALLVLFAFLGLPGEAPRLSARAAVVAGVFLGSSAWWLALALGVRHLASRSALRWVPAVQRFLAGAMCLLGLLLVLRGALALAGVDAPLLSCGALPCAPS